MNITVPGRNRQRLCGARASGENFGASRNVSRPTSGAARGVEWIVARLVPLFALLAYLTTTVLLFAFGPWPYPVKDGTKLYVFLLYAHLAFLYGYLSAAFAKPGGYVGRWSAPRLVSLSTVLSLLLFVPTSVFLTRSLIPDVLGALSDLGGAYAASRVTRQAGMPLIMYVRMILGPLTVTLLPLTVFYWTDLTPSARRLAAVAAIAEVGLHVATGTNAGVARAPIVGFGLFFASRLCRSQGLRWFRSQLRYFLLGAAALAVVFWFFTSTMLSRESSLLGLHFSALGIQADREHLLLRHLPPELQVGAASLISYITQGYYALYLSLDEPFVPMFGVGHSMFLFRQAARVMANDGILDLPYPVRIEKHGWDAYGLWSTIYPWIASDVSFPGTVLVVFVVGRLFALSWIDTLKGANPFAVVVFSQLLLILIFFPGTNQWLHAGEGLVAFWITLLIWLFTRKRYVVGRRRLSR